MNRTECETFGLLNQSYIFARRAPSHSLAHRRNLAQHSRVLGSVKGLAADVGGAGTLGDPKRPVGVSVSGQRLSDFVSRATAHHAFARGTESKEVG